MSPLTEPTKLTLAKDFTWNESVWNPSMIQTALWLDAADASTVQTTGGLVDQINDKSGNGRNFTATGTARPTLTSNGLNNRSVLTFGGSQWLTSTNTSSTWDFLHNTTGSTIIGIWKAGVNTDPNTLFGLCGTAAGSMAEVGIFIGYDDRSSVSRNDRVSASVANGISSPDSRPVFNLSADNAFPANTPTILSVRNDPGNANASSRSFINVNGEAAIQNNTATFTPSSSNPSFTLDLGSFGNGQFPLTGYITEFIVSVGLVSTDQRQRIEGYLAHKWGLTANLPAGHPYKTVGPTP